jgi:uncharacterized protein YegL
MGRKRLTGHDPEREGPPALAPLSLVAERPRLFDGVRAPAPDGPGRPGLLSPMPRIMLMLLLDLSGSMVASGAIAALLVCLRKFREAVLANSLLTRMLEWSVVGFADAPRVLSPYGPISDWEVPVELKGGSGTAMGTAVLAALSLQAEHVEKLASQGLGLRHSLIVILTDGQPTGEPQGRFEEAVRAIAEAEGKGRLFTFLPIATRDADVAKLQTLTPRRTPLGLDQIDYDKFFDWLLVSLRDVSVSQTGARVEVRNPIKSPENPEGWAHF